LRYSLCFHDILGSRRSNFRFLGYNTVWIGINVSEEFSTSIFMVKETLKEEAVGFSELLLSNKLNCDNPQDSNLHVKVSFHLSFLPSFLYPAAILFFTVSLVEVTLLKQTATSGP
jgi:hypothetical protein